MPKELGHVVRDSKIAPQISKGMNEKENMAFVDLRMDANLIRKPERFIHIYNIAPRKFTVRRPPMIPCLHLKACPKGDPYILVAEIPDPMQESWIDPDSGEVRTRGTDGRRVAMDICNPINTGVDLDLELPEELTWVDAGGGDNLAARGLFFSVNNPPTDEEIVGAKHRMETFYRGRIAVAEDLERDNKRSSITNEMHLAADYFGQNFKWHSAIEVPAFCENCGDQIRGNPAYHLNSIGVVCIRNWQRAYEAGAKKLDDVPGAKRGPWWNEAKKAETTNANAGA